MIKPVNGKLSNSALQRMTVKGVPLQRIREGLLEPFRLFCRLHSFSLRIEAQVQGRSARFDLKMKNLNSCDVAVPDPGMIRNKCFTALFGMIPGIKHKEESIKITVSENDTSIYLGMILVKPNGGIDVRVELEGLLDR